MKMKNIFCIIIHSAIAITIFLDFVQAQNDIEKRNSECASKFKDCKQSVEETIKQKVTMDHMLGLCDAKPKAGLPSLCLMECQMRQYEMITDDDGFQKYTYLRYIKKLGHADTSYVQAAETAADMCTDNANRLFKLNLPECAFAAIILDCLQNEGKKLNKKNVGYGIFYVTEVEDLYENSYELP